MPTISPTLPIPPPVHLTVPYTVPPLSSKAITLSPISNIICFFSLFSSTFSLGEFIADVDLVRVVGALPTMVTRCPDTLSNPTNTAQFCSHWKYCLSLNFPLLVPEYLHSYNKHTKLNLISR